MGKTSQSKRDARGELHVEYMSLTDLLDRQWSRNPKLHSTDELQRSFGRFGYTSPPLLNETTGVLVAGHGRVQGLKTLRDRGEPPPARIVVGEAGEWMVPVLRGIAFDSDREAAAYAIADNRLVELGGWDDDELLAVLQEFNDADWNGTGFSPDEMDRLVSTAVLAAHEADRFKEEVEAFTDQYGPPERPHERARTLWVWCEFQTDAEKDLVTRAFGEAGVKKLDPAKLACAAAFIEACQADGRFSYDDAGCGTVDNEDAEEDVEGTDAEGCA